MEALSSPAGRPNTSSLPEAAGRRPRTIWSSVVLPAPLAPMTATIPPAGTSKLACDQMRRPPRTALTSSNVSAASTVRSSDCDTEGLGQRGQLLDLPALEGRLARRHRLGDLDDWDTALLGRTAKLLGYRTLGLSVVDQHVDLVVGQHTEEGFQVRG